MMLWKPWPIEMDDKNDDLPNFNIVILQMLTPLILHLGG